MTENIRDLGTVLRIAFHTWRASSYGRNSAIFIDKENYLAAIKCCRKTRKELESASIYAQRLGSERNYIKKDLEESLERIDRTDLALCAKLFSKAVEENLFFS